VNLEPELVALLSVIASSVAFVLLVIVILQTVRLRGLDRRYVKAFASGEHDVVDALASFALRLEQAETHAKTQDATARKLAETVTHAVSHVAVVRYDAFSDMGGEQSFSLAAIDAHGNGAVVTAINGRSDTRVYAKALRNGTSESLLSGEEQQAIADARERHRAQYVAAQG